MANSGHLSSRIGIKTENWNHAGTENSSSSTRGTKKSVHWIHPVYYTCVRNYP